jgi:tetratricopeptide (TPR) repeat protein
MKWRFVFLISCCWLFGCNSSSTPTQQVGGSPKLVVKEVLIEKLQDAMRKGNYDDLIRSASDAITKDPASFGNYFLRAVGWKEKKEYDKAIADLTFAISISDKAPSNAIVSFVYQVRGDCRYEKDEYDAALADYDRAISLDSKNAAAFNGKGGVYNAKHQYQNALIYYNEAVRLEPQEFAYRHNLENAKTRIGK